MEYMIGGDLKSLLGMYGYFEVTLLNKIFIQYILAATVKFLTGKGLGAAFPTFHLSVLETLPF